MLGLPDLGRAKNPKKQNTQLMICLCGFQRFIYKNVSTIAWDTLILKFVHLEFRLDWMSLYFI